MSNVDLSSLCVTLMSEPVPCIMLVDPQGFAVSVELDGAHPVDVLDSLARREGEAWEVVGILAHGSAMDYATGEPLGRITVAYAIARDESHGMILMPNGISSTQNAEGLIAFSALDFLNGRMPDYDARVVDPF